MMSFKLGEQDILKELLRNTSFYYDAIVESFEAWIANVKVMLTLHLIQLLE